jgi:hypothetical protein
MVSRGEFLKAKKLENPAKYAPETVLVGEKKEYQGTIAEDDLKGSESTAY